MLYCITILGMVSRRLPDRDRGIETVIARPIRHLVFDMFALVFALIAALDRPDSGS